MRSLPHRTGAVAFSIVAAFAGVILWDPPVGLDFWEMDRTVEHLRSEEQRSRVTMPQKRSSRGQGS